MEDGVAFLESSGVLNQVRQLGIATTHWEEAVLAFRSHTPSTPKLNYSKQVHIPPSKPTRCALNSPCTYPHQNSIIPNPGRLQNSLMPLRWRWRLTDQKTWGWSTTRSIHKIPWLFQMCYPHNSEQLDSMRLDFILQMRGFERNFLLAEGLPDRIQYRHVVSTSVEISF